MALGSDTPGTGTNAAEPARCLSALRVDVHGDRGEIVLALRGEADLAAAEGRDLVVRSPAPPSSTG